MSVDERRPTLGCVDDVTAANNSTAAAADEVCAKQSATANTEGVTMSRVGVLLLDLGRAGDELRERQRYDIISKREETVKSSPVNA